MARRVAAPPAGAPPLHIGAAQKGQPVRVSAPTTADHSRGGISGAFVGGRLECHPVGAARVNIIGNA